MADPTIHVTNGIPDAGTGVITTLGQTLLDGANIALGATTDLTTAAGAAGTINSHLRTISRDVAGGIVLQAGGNVIGAVTQSGGPWSISGTVSISGSVTVTGTVAATQSGAWNIGNITGTVSLPSGAATAAKQPSLGVAGTPSLDVLTIQGAASMTPLKVDGSAVTQPISGNVGISGTVNSAQSGTWNVGVTGNVSVVQGGNLVTRTVGNSGNTIDFPSTQNQAAPQAAMLVGAEFNTVPTTITNGNASPLQMDNAGNLLVNVKTGAVAATQSGGWNVGGDVASGSAESGNPIKLGGRAATSNPAAVANNQRVAAMLDKLGKQVAVGALREAKGVQKTSISTTTETTVISAGAAGVFNDVYAIIVTNKSGTGVFIDFKDATGGTTRMTLAAPANDTRGFTVSAGDAMVQAVAANNWTATVSSPVSSIEITMLYVSNL